MISVIFHKVEDQEMKRKFILLLVFFMSFGVFSDDSLWTESEIELRRSFEESNYDNILGLKQRNLFDIPQENESFWTKQLRLTLGGQISKANDIATPSGLARGELELNYRNVFRSRIGLDFLYDISEESTDSEHHPNWYRHFADLETFPIKVYLDNKNQSKILTGLVVRYRSVDNTPSSEEFSHRVSLGPSVIWKNNAWNIRFEVGGYYYFLELDDDHPAENGFTREQLVVESSGIYISSKILCHYGDIDWGGDYNVLIDKDGYLREQTVTSELICPFSTFGLDTIPLFIRIYGGARFFDIDKREDALSFDRDFLFGIDIIIKLDL